MKNETLNFLKMLIHGDELRDCFKCLCGNPDVIWGNRCPLLF